MFRRLFGETDEQQIQYLSSRVLLTLLTFVASLLALLLFKTDITALIAVVMLFGWGWNAVKSLFGIATVGAIFSGNVVFGVVIFVFYVIIAYLVGILCAFLGIGRYIYLKIKRYTQRS